MPEESPVEQYVSALIRFNEAVERVRAAVGAIENAAEALKEWKKHLGNLNWAEVRPWPDRPRLQELVEECRLANKDLNRLWALLGEQPRVALAKVAPEAPG